jgi:glycosyltransferase involved in cell wall biosynthesis
VRRLRVAYVAHSVDPHRGGMELVSARLLERIASEVELEVVAGDGLSTVPQGVRRTHIPIPNRPSIARLLAFDMIASMRLALVRRRVDVVHSCGAVAHGRVDVVTMHLSHAAVVDAQGGVKTPGVRGVRGVVGAFRRRAAARLERRMLRGGRVGLVLAVSKADGRDLAARYPGVDVVVVENGADLDRFAEVESKPQDATRALRVAVVAGDFARKGVPLAIEAVARTRRCELRVAGAGDLHAMSALATAHGAAKRIELLGHVDDVLGVLTWADVVLACSVHESFGLALVEGAAARCAVVCTETGVGPELVGDDGDGPGGAVVPRDAAAIAQLLDELDEDRVRCGAMGEAARRRAIRFTWDEMARATLAAYTALSAAR